jgi:hypothetical protein
MRIARSSKPRRPLLRKQPASARRRRMTRIAARCATAVIADATGAATTMHGRLHRAGRTRGPTIGFTIHTATGGTARTAIRANNLMAMPEIRTILLRGPTCHAPRCGALGTRHAIEAGGSLTITTAARRSKETGSNPSRSGAAALSAAATAIETTTKARKFSGSCFKARVQSERGACTTCVHFLESTARPGPARCARLPADDGPDRADSSARRRRPRARRSQDKARWCGSRRVPFDAIEAC